MATRLYVGNLPYGVTDEGLRQLLGQVGTVVSVELPVDRLTGRPRGFGFADMGTSAEAEAAARRFDGYQLDNRTIRVEVARERVPRAPGFRPSVGRGTEYGFGRRREDRGTQGRGGRGRAA